MHKKTIVLAALMMGIAEMPSVPLSAQPGDRRRCLHGRSESPDQRLRRDDALAVAHDINVAEQLAQLAGAKRYRPLEQLTNISPTPRSFHVQLNTDGLSYTFSVKDMTDPCHYAIFSDQEGLVYEAVVRTSFGMRRVESQ